MWSICQPGQWGVCCPVVGHGVLAAKARLALLLRGDGCALARVRMASAASAALAQYLGVCTAGGAGEHCVLGVSRDVDDDTDGRYDQTDNPVHEQHGKYAG